MLGGGGGWWVFLEVGVEVPTLFLWARGFFQIQIVFEITGVKL